MAHRHGRSAPFFLNGIPKKYPTWDGSGAHFSREIGSTECYGGLMCAMHAAAMAALEREAHAQKRGTSSRPLNLTVEESMAIFDEPETWSERAQGSVERVNEMAKQRMRVCYGSDRGRARTAMTRTIAWAIDPAGQPHPVEVECRNVPNLGWVGCTLQSVEIDLSQLQRHG
jgi:hypothetical protein